MLGRRARTEGTKMSKLFAEKIIDSMVDESGYCGERALSKKQFDIIAQWLDPQEAEITGRWCGRYTNINFTSTHYVGRIGKYEVDLNLYYHFNPRYLVVSIHRVYDKTEEQMLNEYKEKMSSYTWNHEVGDRLRNVNVTCTYKQFIEETEYGDKWMYQFTDGKSLFVWFTGSKGIDEDDQLVMSMTVKSLNEYKGTKQTVVTRARIID